MAIIQQPDSLCFSGNLKDFIISGFNEISFILKSGDLILINEVYTADNNRIEISVRDVIEQQLSVALPGPDDDIFIQNNAYKSFQAHIGSTVVNFIAVKGGIGDIAETSAVFMKTQWLTLQPQQKHTYFNQPEWLNYYTGQVCRVKVKAYYLYGRVEEKYIADLEADKLYTLDVSYSKISEKFVEQILYYDIWIEDADRRRLTYMQRYVLSPIKDKAQVYIFENTLGGIDSVGFEGNFTEKLTTTGIIASLREVSSDSDIDFSVIYEQNTGYLPSLEYARWLRGFFFSKQRYHVTDSFRKIYIEESENSFSVMDLNSYTFEFRYSKQTKYDNAIRNNEDLPELLEFPTEDELFFLAPRLAEFPIAAIADDLFLPAQFPFEDKWRRISVAAIVQAAISASVDAAQGSIDLTQYWKKTELIRDELYLKFLDKKISAGFADEADNSTKWNGKLMPQWLDQPVRTVDNVKFHKVTAKELVEQLESLSTDFRTTVMDGEQVSDLLTEEGSEIVATTLGELTNVDNAADNTVDSDVILFKAKGSNTWTTKLLSEIGGGQTGVQRNVRIINNLDSKNLSASKGELCYLDFTFISQERYSEDERYEDTGERGLCQISIKNTNNDDFVVVKQVWVSSNVAVKMDVAEFLSSGSNQVMIKVMGEITEVTTPAFVYTVQLTSLSISANNFKWWTAYTGNIILPLNIGGNISKILHVAVIGKDYNETYEVSLGTNIYTETAYNYTIQHPGTTGVFNVSAYVSSVDGTIRTKTISFNIICAVSGSTAKLIAINNIIDKAINWTENILFSYTMYDGDNVYTSARFVVKKEDTVVFESNESSITTSTNYSFSIPMEIETLDNSEFNIEVEVLSGKTQLTDSIIIPVNNSLGYSAVMGAVFYLNPKTRSNQQGNYKSIINEIDKSTISATWSNMNWGNDGWTADADGNKVLRIMAGSKLSIDYFPFKKESSRTGKTIEIDYLINNVTDDSKDIINISTDQVGSFTGLRIFPEDIVMYSQILKNTKVQSIKTNEDKRIRLTLVIMPDAYGNSEFNLCIIYINGKKNREFTYENNDYFAQDGGIEIGSDYGDVDLYGIRIYDSALTSNSVLRNYINWLATTEEKEIEKNNNDVLDANGSEIDFENTVGQYNVMVFDNTIPRILDPSARTGTLEVYFIDHPERNVKITNVEAKGQGTSSMRYYLWNTKYAINKTDSVITYADGTTGTKTWQMVPEIPPAAKFTAKKNYASSMQSHKMGSVNSVQDLYKKLGFSNEAMETEKYKDARIAVYQLPFVCFEKSVNDEGQVIYTFAGEYTFGPDKGDKYTFGYDTDLFPGLISIEGSDNAPLATLFRVPWNSKMAYNEDEEAFQYNGANAWDFDGGEVSNIEKWIPAYNFVYSCSNRLRPFDGTLEELQSQSAILRSQSYEFWIAKEGDPNLYNVYYYESSENKFAPSDIGNGTINLVLQLTDKDYGLSMVDLTGKTNEQLNALFISARIQKFKQEAGTYWDIKDAILHRNWVEIHAGTDQRAKNTYPYNFGTSTSQWKWRYDDMDTIFDTDNEGQPEKSYSVEFHDVTLNGASVWNGETSNFWNLLDLAFVDEIESEMKRTLIAMEELGSLKSGSDWDKLFAYFKKYYFEAAQEYFPANIVNGDAKIAYENGKLAYNKGIYTNDTDPMTQSLGDHYSAETRWITKRLLYIMSKYSFGLFSANGTDSITVRAAGDTITYNLTPSMDLYPAIANGTSIIRGGRTKTGEVCSMVIELSGSADQQNTIQGASYLQDIGDWHDKNISGSMIIQGKKLREIRLGSKKEPITISITSLTVSNCISLQKIILSNISTLSGSLNLALCTHLQEVYIDGTSLVQVKLPVGGGLRAIEFSAYNQYLQLSNYPLMTNEGINIELCKTIITDFLVVDCPLMKPMQLLVEIINAQTNQGAEHALKRIRAVGFEEDYDSSDMLDKLSTLADGSYEGLNSEGLAGEDEYPVLDGTINIYANAYEDNIEAIRGKFKKLILNVFGELYVRFKDSVITSILVSHFSSDGVGLTKEDVEKVTDLGDYYSGNTQITSFDELVLFTNLRVLKNNMFLNCTNLKSLRLPQNPVLNLINYRFAEGAGLEGELAIPDNITRLDGSCFKGTNLTSIIGLNHITVLQSDAFRDCIHLETIDGLNAVTGSIGGGAFQNCAKLKSVITIPGGVTSLANVVFGGCKSIPYLIFLSETPPALSYQSLGGNDLTFKIYVPDESLIAYKTGTNWSSYANRIYPLSQKPE